MVEVVDYRGVEDCGIMVDNWRCCFAWYMGKLLIYGGLGMWGIVGMVYALYNGNDAK